VITRNLRHLRLLVAIADTSSLTAAAALCGVTQPAVSQALSGLEEKAGGALFERRAQGLFPTGRGAVALGRLRRALSVLDEALAEASPRLILTATSSQLLALLAVSETGNFTLAARRLGISQPTVHRSVSQIEADAGRNLFDRAAHGIVPTRLCRTLARAIRLAMAELDQCDADLAEQDGREVGRITIGAMPLSRSALLPRALARFRAERPTLPVLVLDGPYDALLDGLRRGEVDFLVGALRDPAPVDDVEQTALFTVDLVILCGLAHPLAGRRNVQLAELAAYPFIVARAGTPTRDRFDALMAPAGGASQGIVESGSILLMREMLAASDHLGFISRLQASAEIALGLVTVVDHPVPGSARPIGITTRRGWQPTAAQRRLLALVAEAAPDQALSRP